jgi:dTDP-4-amino-4,6-dideoxy-D-galactose acyltransferase
MHHKKIQYLAWDSKFWGYKVGKIIYDVFSKELLKDIIYNARKEGFVLLYAFIDPHNSSTNQFFLENNGLLVDEKITYVKNLAAAQIFADDNKCIISYKNRPLTKNLADLAIQAGTYSRFRLDPHFVYGEYKHLYTKWIENSLNGIISDDVFVYLQDNKEVGFITLSMKQERADIGLLSVNTEFQGRGIGTALIITAEEEAIAMDKKIIQVVTQKNNIPACHLYEKCGFKKERIENVYHFWLTEDNENSL